MPTAGEKYPFSTHHLYQSFVPTKSSLYSIGRPALVVVVVHFPFAFSASATSCSETMTRRGNLVAFSPQVFGPMQIRVRGRR